MTAPFERFKQRIQQMQNEGQEVSDTVLDFIRNHDEAAKQAAAELVGRQQQEWEERMRDRRG